MPIDLIKFQQNLYYANTAPIANIVADLNQIAEIQKLAEIEKKKYGKQAVYYFFGVVVSILGAVFFNVNTALIILFVILATGFLIAFIYALRQRGKYKRLNVNNNRYESAKKILQMLARDMDSAGNIEISLSFTPTQIKENRINTVNHPSKSGWKIDNYQNQWLTIKGQFLDKTRFDLTATELSKTQYGNKRSRSGKTKHKSKTKILGLDVSLTLTYPQRRYGTVKILKNEVSGAIKLPNFCQLKGVKVTDKAMGMLVRISPGMVENPEEIYKTITMMFLSFYQVLNLGKILAK